MSVKLKVKSLQFLVDNADKFDLSMENLKFAGKTVTFAYEEDGHFAIKEDPQYDWHPDLFENVSHVPRIKPLKLKEEIQGEENAVIFSDGKTVEIGCETISFEVVKQIYDACVAQQQAFTKPKAKAKKKPKARK